MKIKTVFSDFGLFADERANFFQYRRTDGRFIVRPLQPYLKSEHLELFRFEKEDGVFYAPVQLRRSGRKLVSRLMDVVGGHRFYKLLGEGLAFCEKGHLWRRGCRFEICEWRIFFPDAFGDLVEVTRRLVDRRKAYICAVESENGVLSVKINAFADGITTCCYRCEGGDCILQKPKILCLKIFAETAGKCRLDGASWKMKMLFAGRLIKGPCRALFYLSVRL